MTENTLIDGAQLKKPRQEIDGSENRRSSINDLPEDVITRIVSLLPLKDAVRTSVLSKIWEYKWASVSSIVIDDELMNKAGFVSFVDRILVHSHNIQDINVSCRYVCDPTILTRWIFCLSSRTSIQNITMLHSDCEMFTLPHCLLENTSLFSLEIDLPCIMKIPVKDCLCSLKFLTLSKIFFQNDNISNTDGMIMTFPVLESLVLERCTWGNIKFVEINSPLLTKFAYMSHGTDAIDILIKVSAAKLNSFLNGSTLPLNNFDLDASSLVSAFIGIGNPISDHIYVGDSESPSGISIRDFLGLKDLSLFGLLSKTYAQLMPGLPLPKFDRLKQLSLYLVASPEALLELLHMAPTLEHLTIDQCYDLGHYSEDYSFDAAGSVPSCMLSRLTKINFPKFLGAACQLTLVKFLLKNSLKLEKVVVSVHSEPLIAKANIKELLSTYPKGSACISLVVT